MPHIARESATPDAARRRAPTSSSEPKSDTASPFTRMRTALRPHEPCRAPLAHAHPPESCAPTDHPAHPRRHRGGRRAPWAAGVGGALFLASGRRDEMGEAPEGAPARPAPQTRVPVALLATTPAFEQADRPRAGSRGLRVHLPGPTRPAESRRSEGVACYGSRELPCPMNPHAEPAGCAGHETSCSRSWPRFRWPSVSRRPAGGARASAR
jgi:hypothetical protein